MKHIILIGDSIFDNAPYVDRGDSVSELLNAQLAKNDKITLLAVDGDTTIDVGKQLSSYPANATDTFVSCGGNDALRMLPILKQGTSTVGSALDILSETISIFRINYKTMLTQILSHTDSITVCTIYNQVPGMNTNALTALALFNEIIIQLAIELGLDIIDLRVICNDEKDYSPISPIEPSKFGAQKIVDRILYISSIHKRQTGFSKVYT